MIIRIQQMLKLLEFLDDPDLDHFCRRLTS